MAPSELSQQPRTLAAYLDADDSERRWGLLPERMRQMADSENEWQKLVRAHGIAVQASWSMAAGGDEGTYLDDLLRHSREKAMLYPYHLADALAVHHPRVSPFDYYLELVSDTMRAERSYDTIPNFTAADCVRLLGVGRNEFIHALNTCRSKGWLWKRRKGIVAKQLPSTPPITLPICHWWEVRTTMAGNAALARHTTGRGRGATRQQQMQQMRRSVAEKISAARASYNVGSGGGGSAMEEGEELDGVGDEGDNGGAGASGASDGRLSASEMEVLAQLASTKRPLLAGELSRGVRMHALALLPPYLLRQ